MRRRARALLAEFGLDIDVAAPLGEYSVAVQQMVAIARAVDLSRAGADPGRADRQPRRGTRSRCCSASCASWPSAASASSSSRISSTRSTRSPTASPCCATAAWSASARPPTLPRLELIRMMLGRELAETTSARAAAQRPPAREICASSRTTARPACRAVRSRAAPWRGRRPRRAARLGPHRDGAAGVRRRARR